MKRTLVLLSGHGLSPGEDNSGWAEAGGQGIAPAALYDAAFRDSVQWAEDFRPGAEMAPPNLVLGYYGDKEWFRHRVSSHWLMLPLMGTTLAQHLDNLLIVLGSGPDDRTIFVGPLTPHLPARALDSAFILLGQREVVLAPCERAGIYLIGARGRWPSGLLHDVRWDTAHAQKDLLKIFRRTHLGVGLLEELYAVQTERDLQRLADDLGVYPDRAMPNLRRLVDAPPAEGGPED